MAVRQEREQRRQSALPARPIAAAVLRTGRRHAGRILVVSIAVSLVITAVEIALDHLLSHAGLAAALAGALCSSAVSLLGAVFLAGFLSRLVSAEHGAGPVRLGAVLRSLPWGSLVAADLLVTLIVLLGLVLLIIPGLIALNLLVVVGPVIEIEDRRPWAGLRRSAQLVRPHFWKVALIGTLPVVVASGLEAALPDPESQAGLVTALITRSIVEGVLEALVGLLLVELCYRLIAARAEGGAPPTWTEERGSEASERRGKLGGSSAPGGAKLASRLQQPPEPGRAGGAGRY